MTEHQGMKQALNQMIGGFWMSQAIYAAAELGIADLLVEGPQTPAELANGAKADAGALHRLLRALASAGIFSEDDQGRFALTPLAENLRSDVADSQRSFAMMMGAEAYQIWGHLLHSVQTGEQACEKALGKPLFQYLTENPARGKVFDAAMTGIHGGETEPMIDAYDFSLFQKVVDVGGGNGQVLSAVLNRHPSLEGVLFDLPEVVERARLNVAGTGVAERCEILGGDFFASVAAGGDAYLMRHILHDWDDKEAVQILRNCREAMNSGGKILAVETVIPPGNEANFGKWLDLMMLVIGGRERTKEQYETLFANAGLKLSRIVSTSVEISVIEGVRAD